MTSTSTAPEAVTEVTPQKLARHLQKRRPAVLRSIPPDLSALTAWSDLSHLRKIGGDAAVKVEPIDKARRQYGSGAERKSMRFGKFLDKLEAGKHLYLTTQYEDDDGEDEDGDEDDVDVASCFPGVVRPLLKDTYIPLVPASMKGLVLSSMNLWLGQSRNGASSGLHHDFHDNLYILLKGRKRFVLYPPKCAKHLRPYGNVEKVYKNGLIVYEGMPSPIRQDGLSELDALKYKVKALERLKKEARGKERKKLEQEYEEAVEAMMEAAMDGEMDDIDGEDDFDGLDDDESSVHSQDNEKPRKRARLDAVESDERTEPDSFSRIPADQLHTYLGLSSSPVSVTAENKAALEAAGQPLIVELKAGDALYLPASWWHEVTSFGSDDDNKAGRNVHMAFNYWFHPPDNIKGGGKKGETENSGEGMYENERIWSHVAHKVEQEYRAIRGV